MNTAKQIDQFIFAETMDKLCNVHTRKLEIKQTLIIIPRLGSRLRRSTRPPGKDREPPP